MHGKILTTDNLRGRGMQIINRCYLCKEVEESIKHLFLECPFTLKFWTYIWDRFQLAWVMNKGMEQFVDNWHYPFFHPYLKIL